MSRRKTLNPTKKKLLEEIAVLEELEALQRASRDAYKPNDMQKRVHKSEAKLRLVVSGNGAGKTALAANEAIWSCKGYNPITGGYIPVPRRVIIVLDHPDKVADKYIPEIRKWFNIRDDHLHKDGKHYITRISFKNGSEMKFMFHAQSELAFESIEADDIIFDEPPKTRQIYVALIRGMRNKGKNPRVMIVGTPITGSWLRTDIYDPWANGELEDAECFRFSTDVNKDNLPEGYVDWYKRQLTKKEADIRIHGMFFDLEGLALGDIFDRKAHVIEPFDWPREWPVVVAVDPHPSKAHVATILGTDGDGYLYVIDEMAAKSLPRDFARELKAFYGPYRVLDVVCDSLGSQEYTGGEGFKSFIQVLKDEGVPIRPTTWEEKSDESFILRLQDVMAKPSTVNNFGQSVPKLRIFDNCCGMIKDIETVKWQWDKQLGENKRKLDIVKCDYLATLKYALASGLPDRKRTGDKPYYLTKSVYGVKRTPGSRKKVSSNGIKFKRRPTKANSAEEFFSE